MPPLATDITSHILLGTFASLPLSSWSFVRAGLLEVDFSFERRGREGSWSLIGTIGPTTRVWYKFRGFVSALVILGVLPVFRGRLAASAA
jgi:hypothetical protein